MDKWRDFQMERILIPDVLPDLKTVINANKT